MKMRKCVIYFGFNNPLKFKRGVENVILFQAQSLGENIEKYYIFFDDENVEFNWNGINCIGIRKNKFRFISLNKLINRKFKNKKYIIHSHNYLMSFFLLKKKNLFRPGRLGGRLIRPPPNWALEALLSKEKPSPASTRRLGWLGGRVLEP